MMAWGFAGLVILLWWLHGRGLPGGVADAGGLTPGEKAALIAAHNKAADALKAANTPGFLLLHWTELRLQTNNNYIAILEDGSSDYVNYTAAGVRAEVCFYTKSAAEILSKPTLEYC
jgi:hypothetical protein